MSHKLSINPRLLQDVCKRYRIRSLALFGSAVRDDFREDSDVDMLVEFDPRDRPGMVATHQLETELSGVYGGRRIHLVNRKFLNPRLRSRILAEAQLQFAEG